MVSLHQRRFKCSKKKKNHFILSWPHYGPYFHFHFMDKWTWSTFSFTRRPLYWPQDSRGPSIPIKQCRTCQEHPHLPSPFHVSNLHERFKSGVKTAWDFNLTQSLHCTTTHNTLYVNADRIEECVTAQTPQLQSTIMTVNKESAAKSLQILKSPSWLWISSISWSASLEVVCYCTAVTWTNKKMSHHSGDVSYSLRRGTRQKERRKESWVFFIQ